MKNILVVGGSSGIGLALVKRLLRQGYEVWVASRNKPLEINQLQVHYISTDLSRPNAKINHLPDKLDGVVYAPGSINLKPFHRYTEQDFMQDFEVNVMGAIRTLQACFPALKKSENASVVLFSTVAVQTGMSFHSSIAVAKGGIEGLTRALAAEWSANRIRVNAIAPSLTDTPLAEKLLSSAEKREASGKRHPLGRIGDAEDIANLAHFLISEESSWITGQILGIDGGMSTLKP